MERLAHGTEAEVEATESVRTTEGRRSLVKPKRWRFEAQPERATVELRERRGADLNLMPSWWSGSSRWSCTTPSGLMDPGDRPLPAEEMEIRK